jgi:hypothetical protein
MVWYFNCIKLIFIHIFSYRVCRASYQVSNKCVLCLSIVHVPGTCMPMISAMKGSLGQKILAKLEKEEDGASHCWCTYAGEVFLRLSEKANGLQ